MSTSKNNKRSGFFNFSTFQSTSRPANDQYHQASGVSKPKKSGRRFVFQETEENPSPTYRSTPIEMIHSTLSRQPQPVKQKIQQIVIAPAPPLAEQDKDDGYLDVQTADSLQRETFPSLPVVSEQQTITISQQQDVSELFSTLLTEELSSFLTQLQAKSKIRNIDRIRSFFKFYQNIDSWIDGVEGKMSSQQSIPPFYGCSLREWAGNALKQVRLSNSAISFKDNSQILDYLLSGRENQLIDKLTSEKKYSLALTIANFEDKVVRQRPSRGFILLKKEFNIINTTRLSILSESCWLYEFILAAHYLSIPFEEAGFEICSRYLNHSLYFYQVELLRLGLLLSAKKSGRKMIPQGVIEKLIDKLRPDQFTEGMLFFFILSKHKDELPGPYQQVLKFLMKEIVDPKLVIQTLEFARVPQEKVYELLQVYLKNNTKHTKDTNFKEELIRHICSSSKQSSIQSTSSLILKQWVLQEELYRLQSQGNPQAFVQKVVHDYETIRSSTIVDFGQTIKQLQEAITSFKLACNYKRQKKNEYFQLLQKAEKKIVATSKGKQVRKQEQQALEVLTGCRAFVELSLGIFILSEPKRLSQLIVLYQYLRKAVATRTEKSGSASTSKFITYLEEILLRALQTREGHLYLLKQLTIKPLNLQNTIIKVLNQCQKSPQSPETLEILEKSASEHSDLMNLTILLKIVGKRGFFVQKMKVLASVSQ